MHRWTRAGTFVVAAGCGRIGFDATSSVTVYEDFSDQHQYIPEDLIDTDTYDNEPVVLCPLEPPFTAPLAVIAGRAVLELPTDGPVVLHDYHPGTANSGGPDRFVGCRAEATPSTGMVLWLSAASETGGDGLFYVTPQWLLTRDTNLNNIGGVVLDATGSLTGGVPDLIYMSNARLFARPAHVELVDLMVRTHQLAPARDGSFIGAFFPIDFSRNFIGSLDPGTFAITELLGDAMPARIAVETVPEGTGYVYAILEYRHLGVVDEDGTFRLIASAESPDARWVSVAAPRAGHPLAGALYVLEVDRVADRDRVLRVTFE